MIEGQELKGGVSRLNYAMLGGGQGAFIGDVHRKAIALDGKAELVGGCFSQDFENTRTTAKIWGLGEDRIYPSYEEMFTQEGRREDKIDFVVIVTPNVHHFPMAKAALENGIHVVCDKPLTTRSLDSEELERLAAEKDLLFCVTYAYTGYPMVKHLREMILQGELGEIRFVNAEYPQDWLATPLEETGQKQALWRGDPNLAGGSNCVGDIGSHIENMVSYLTGLKIRSLCARLDIFGKGRSLDDNASILLEYEGGAKGMYWSSQIAVGHDNGFRVRIYGTKGGLEWCQESPNYARVSFVGKPTETLSRGRGEMYPRAANLSRIPAGHPEGYFEAFANVYSTFLTTLDKKISGEELTADDLDYPGVADGIQGVRFIEKCVESSNAGAVWTDF
jgi:predicted dehydrogenase